MASDKNVVRLLTLGDSGSGKSALMRRYVSNEFNSDFAPTIGIDFMVKTATINDQPWKVQIWDTAGQERFRTITNNYYRGAHGILLVYDVTKRETFESVRKWMADIERYAEGSCTVVLVGNKVDLEDKKVVSTSEGKSLADELRLSFFETSAKNDINVQAAFAALVEKSYEKNRGFKKAGGDGTVPVEQEGGKKGCC